MQKNKFHNFLVTQTSGGFLDAPERSLHVLAQRVSSLFSQSACCSFRGIHHLQVGHPNIPFRHVYCENLLHSNLSMGIAAFITEISTPEQRTFRLAMIHFVSSLGSPIGTKVHTGYFQYRKEKQLSALKVYTKGSTLCSDWSSSLGRGWEGPALHVHLRGRPWRQACHADLFGRQARDV